MRDDGLMNDWGRAKYGDPCRECGFSWGMSLQEAIVLVTDLPDSYAGTLRGANGSERHPDLAWSVCAYVCHVADNLGIGAERLMGVVRGAPSRIPAYDENLLAEARRYEEVALEAALWSLERSVGDWREAVKQADRKQVTLLHPERGELTVADAALFSTHDAFHHHWDIQRSLDWTLRTSKTRHSGQQPE